MNLQKQYPKAWADFEKWYKLTFKNPMYHFKTLPFEMQLGVYLKYIEDNGIGIHSNSIANYNIKIIKEKIEQVFKTREERL